MPSRSLSRKTGDHAQPVRRIGVSPGDGIESVVAIHLKARVKITEIPGRYYYGTKPYPTDGLLKAEPAVSTVLHTGSSSIAADNQAHHQNAGRQNS